MRPEETAPWGPMSPVNGCLVVVALCHALACGSGEVCADCMDEKCSDLLALCEAEAECGCMAACMGETGVPGVTGCLDTCGLAERPVAFIPVETCVAVACPDSGDECATPDDWTAPESMICEGSMLGIGSGTLPDCSFDPGLGFDPDGTVLQLESADQNVCVRLERRDDGAGTLANTSFTLLDMRVGPLGEVALIEEPSSQCWYSSHHNFRDLAHAWTGTRHYDLVLAEDGHDGTRGYELYVFEQGPIDAGSCAPSIDGSECIDGPIALFPVNP